MHLDHDTPPEPPVTPPDPAVPPPSPDVVPVRDPDLPGTAEPVIEPPSPHPPMVAAS